MVESFFFIPADKTKFINKIPEIEADHFILDFEDSIKTSNINEAIENVKKIPQINKFWARPALFEKKNLKLDLFQKLLDIGIRNMVLPKIEERKQLKNIAKIKGAENCKFILLIESAKAFENINKLVTFRKINITGLVLGSHDFANDLMMKYDMRYLNHFRQELLVKSKAYNIKPIDIASMDINDTKRYKEEVLSGFEMGYRAKMILHPTQIISLNEIKYFTDDEVAFAKEVIKEYPKLSNEIEAVNFNGRILEKPHIERIIEVLKYAKK